MRGLVIKPEPLEKILVGKKTWEIRGSRTKIRGSIALIESGSGHVVGVCDLVDCLGPLSRSEMLKNTSKHRIGSSRLKQGPLSRKTNCHAWVVRKARGLKKPLPYKHPQGAIIWVNLGKAMTPANQRSLARIISGV